MGDSTGDDRRAPSARARPPDAEHEPALWSAGAVAHRLGIAPTTLRSWHHRYGLEPVTPPPGHHRRYREQDIAVLELMARLVAHGVVPAAAARIAREQPDAAPPPDERQPTREQLGERIAEQAVRGLVLAALRLDATTLRHVLDDAITTGGLEQTWLQLCVPALDGLGRRVTPTGGCVDAVLLLSSTISNSLHRASGIGRPRSRARRAVLACPAGERHSLGLDVLHAALATRGVDVIMLGAAVPTPVLLAAADRIRPAAVVVWSQMPRTARPTLLRDLTALTATTIAAGPGWRHTRLPAGILHVTDLRGAVTAITRATSLVAAPHAD
jgi:DNA-binding transcriptional MerR regulator